jgi:MFS family permease
MLVLSAYSGQLASRIGPRLQMSVGPIVVGAGLLLLTRATDGASYATYVLPAVVVFGIGLAITVAPLTSTAMGAAPPEHAGSASAINNVVARAAGLIAVAVLPFAAGIAGTSALSPHEFAPGFRTAMVIAGTVCAAGGLLAVALIRNPPGVEPGPPTSARRWQCALDAAPLEPTVNAQIVRTPR